MTLDMYGGPEAANDQQQSEVHGHGAYMKTRPCTSNTNYKPAHVNKSVTTHVKSKRHTEQDSEIEINQSPRLKNFQSHSNLVYGNPAANQTFDSFKRDESAGIARAMSGAVSKPKTGAARSHQSRMLVSGDDKQNQADGAYTNQLYYNGEDNSVQQKSSVKNRRIVSVRSRPPKKSTVQLVESSSRVKPKNARVAPAAVENNAVSQACISMKQVIARSRAQTAASAATLQKQIRIGDQGHTPQLFKIGPALARGLKLNDTSTYVSNQDGQGAHNHGINQSQVDNLNYIRTVNLRKHIPQGINRDIINRNKTAIASLSMKNKRFIQNQQRKELDLPPGAIDQLKSVRPKHSVSRLLKSFGKTGQAPGNYESSHSPGLMKADKARQKSLDVSLFDQIHVVDNKSAGSLETLDVQKSSAMGTEGKSAFQV
jgi:hypothetical protein